MASMARLTCCLMVLVCLAAAANAQIFFGGSQQPRQPPRQPPRPASPLGASCPMPGGGTGRCGRVQGCASLMRHIRSGNVNFLKQLVCGKFNRQTLLCCPDGVPPPPTVPAPLPTPDPSPEACGISKLFVPPRVVGGVPVEALGTFPWMVALRYDLGTEFQCGAAVIGRRWLLTASHCVQITGGPIGARIGDLDLYSPKEDDFIYPPQDIEIELLIRHPKYVRSFRGLQNDVALIKLKGDIKYSEVVRPICLPANKSAIPPSGPTVIAGWGLTEAGATKGSNEMLYANLNITDINTCKRNYMARRNYVFPEQHLCATGNITSRGETLHNCPPGDTSLRCQGGIDTCRGDSGGPLMSYEKLAGAVRFTAVGVVSFAVGCGSPKYPGVYARVDTYIDWIHETIAANGGM